MPGCARLALLMICLVAGAGASPVVAHAGGGWWRPVPGLDWQMQLSGPLDLSVGRDVFFLDLFDATDADLETLRERGTRVVCYVSAGSWEDWREDADRFPTAAIGDPLDGWPGESWLDVRSPDLRPIMSARLDLAVERGCDGVDPDNVDGYANDGGFPLTGADQLGYIRWLADAAHDRGLAIGLKNDLGQVPDLVDEVDWQVNEQCVEYEECDALLPFTAAGKPVFGLEYPRSDRQTIDDRAAEVCAVANRLEFDTLIKPLDLTAARLVCAQVDAR